MRPCLGLVGEKRARGSKCLKEEMDALVWLFGGGADEHGAEEPNSRPFEVPQSKRGELRVRVEGRLVAGRRRKSETRQGPGRDVESEPHRSPDGPVPAGRIRRLWEAWECAAMGSIVGLELVVCPGRVVGVGFVAGRAKREKPHP